MILFFLLEDIYFWLQESPFFEHLRVMTIEDMIFLVHVKELAEYVNSSLSLRGLYFVDLEQDPPKVGYCRSVLYHCFLVFTSLMPPFITHGLLSTIFLQMITQKESSLVGAQLVPILNLFSQHFPLEENGRIQLCSRADETDGINSTDGETSSASQNSEFIDLSICMMNTKISIPTLNG